MRYIISSRFIWYLWIKGNMIKHFYLVSPNYIALTLIEILTLSNIQFYCKALDR